MKSIANQYRDLKEGRMSQFNFMRNLRMTMPEYITNVTSFKDAVRILKNKAILAEAYDGPSEPGGNEALGDYYEAVGEELEDIARQKYNLDEKEIEQMFENEWHSGKNDNAIEKYYKDGDEPSVVAERIIEDYMQMEDDIANQIDRMEDEESGKYTKFQDFEGGLSENVMDPDSPDFVISVEEYLESAGLTPEQEKAAIEYLNDNAYDLQGDFANSDTVDGGTYAAAKYIAKIIKSKTPEMPGFEGTRDALDDLSIREGKKKEPKKELHPNQIHPGELRMGIRVEMEHTDDPKKAEKIALDHLAENPYYYTALKLAGVESPSAPKVKAPVEKKAKKKKEAVELVDKANAMQKVKMPKVVKENLNEAGGEYTFNGTLTDDEKKELDKILNYKGSYELEVDEVDDHYETTIIHDFYNEKNLEHAVKQVTGRLPQKKQFGDTVGFDNVLQSKLESLVREVMNEMLNSKDDTK